MIIIDTIKAYLINNNLLIILAIIFVLFILILVIIHKYYKTFKLKLPAGIELELNKDTTKTTKKKKR